MQKKVISYFLCAHIDERSQSFSSSASGEHDAPFVSTATQRRNSFDEGNLRRSCIREHILTRIWSLPLGDLRGGDRLAGVGAYGPGHGPFPSSPLAALRAG